MQTLLPGITAERLPTSRLTAAVLSVTGRTAEPVLFVHGNVSSSLFWQPTMLALPDGCRPLAVDLRGFGETDPEPVDATRGLGDYADDLAAVIEALDLTSVHLVGWSRCCSRRPRRAEHDGADARADPCPAGRLRRGWQAVLRDRHPGLGARSAS